MCRLCIEKLAPDATPQADLAGLRATITIPDVPAKVRTWQEFLAWLQEHPEVISAIIMAVLTLLSFVAPPPKAG